MKPIRTEKGLSLLEFPEDYVVIDIETSDMNYFYGEIIEIACVKIKNNQIVETLDELIKPKYKIRPFTTQLTGITNEMVQNKEDITTILLKLKEFIQDEILIGHNVNFDVNYIYDAMLDKLNLPLSNNFIDTLRLSRRLVSDVKNHKLQTLAKYFNATTPTHRAMADVMATHHVFNELKAIAKENPNKLILKQSSKNKQTNLELIKATINPEEIKPNNYFYNKRVCFTGKMDFLTKKDAAQIITNLGAHIQKDVDHNTNVLILGNLEYQQRRFNDKSSKHKKAELLIEHNINIEILTERSFLELIDEES